MTKQEKAVLMALSQNKAGLLKGDFREATRREVSSHTVEEEQLKPLTERGLIATSEEKSSDGRIKALVTRYTITEAGEAELEGGLAKGA